MNDSFEFPKSFKNQREFRHFLKTILTKFNSENFTFIQNAIDFVKRLNSTDQKIAVEVFLNEIFSVLNQTNLSTFIRRLYFIYKLNQAKLINEADLFQKISVYPTISYYHFYLITIIFNKIIKRNAKDNWKKYFSFRIRPKSVEEIPEIEKARELIFNEQKFTTIEELYDKPDILYDLIASNDVKQIKNFYSKNLKDFQNQKIQNKILKFSIFDCRQKYVVYGKQEISPFLYACLGGYENFALFLSVFDPTYFHDCEKECTIGGNSLLMEIADYGSMLKISDLISICFTKKTNFLLNICDYADIEKSIKNNDFTPFITFMDDISQSLVDLISTSLNTDEYEYIKSQINYVYDPSDGNKTPKDKNEIINDDDEIPHKEKYIYNKTKLDDVVNIVERLDLQLPDEPQNQKQDIMEEITLSESANLTDSYESDYYQNMVSNVNTEGIITK